MRWSCSARGRVGIALICLLTGCNQSPYWSAQRTGFPATPGAPGAPAYTAQVQDLSRRTSALDADNRDLHSELARSQQQVQVLQDEVGLLRDQLHEKATDLREMLLAKEDADKRVDAIEAATRHRGGATITANSSLRNSLTTVDLPGLDVRREAGLIRIELPSDRLFRQQSDQLLPDARRWIDLVANAIRETYPQQLIGIEGHSDGQSGIASSSHQLAASQATAVFQTLTRYNRLPEQQLFIAAYGANRPVVSNATPAGRAQNRRVEIVIYPETAETVR